MVIHYNLVQTDRAAMLDEIVDYVKFLRLQVKVYAVREIVCIVIPILLDISLYKLTFK